MEEINISELINQVSFIMIRETNNSQDKSSSAIFLMTEKGKKRFEENNINLSWNKLSKESFKSFFIHSDFSGDIYCFTNEDMFMHNLKQLFDIETNNGYLNNRHKEISTPTHYIMILE